MEVLVAYYPEVLGSMRNKSTGAMPCLLVRLLHPIDLK